MNSIEECVASMNEAIESRKLRNATWHLNKLEILLKGAEEEITGNQNSYEFGATKNDNK